jgi:hypothetical protein
MPKHVGIELDCNNNKNPLLHRAFVGILTYGTTRCSVQQSTCIEGIFGFELKLYCFEE